ncbi:hypothetical protein GOV04_00590 [Candidatus Woesearchaeota archaeon]|nr:hypothetical protein [Candidatus Woesearchaeota archaeon]
MKKKGAVKKKSLQTKKKNFVPAGIKVLIGYTSFLGIFYLTYLIFGAYVPTTVLFGKIIEGSLAVLINMVYLTALLVLLYGLIKRKRWGWELALGWYIFGIIDSIISTIIIKANNFSILASFVQLSSLGIIFMNVVALWYLISKKDYFLGRKFDRHFHVEDQIFVTMTVIFLSIMLVLIVGAAKTYYDTTKTLTASAIDDLSGKTLFNSILTCEQKFGEFRDSCYLVTVIMHENAEKVTLQDVCDRIQSTFFKFTCMRAIT